MKAYSTLLSIALAALLTGCFGDDKDKNQSPEPTNPGNGSPVNPGEPNSRDSNPFLNMKSENYRLSAQLNSVPAIKTRNDKTIVTATITPVYRPQGENK